MFLFDYSFRIDSPKWVFNFSTIISAWDIPEATKLGRKLICERCPEMFNLRDDLSENQIQEAVEYMIRGGHENVVQLSEFMSRYKFDPMFKNMMI